MFKYGCKKVYLYNYYESMLITMTAIITRGNRELMKRDTFLKKDSKPSSPEFTGICVPNSTSPSLEA